MRSRRNQSGFTIVEMIIVTCIIGVLAAVAISSARDYTRRAQVSEAVLATGTCKTMISETYPVLDSVPIPGGWGCEQGNGTHFSSPVQTSENGVIRIRIQNVDASVNNRYIYLVPALQDGNTAMTVPADYGKSVRAWICGSDWSLARKALPANCRIDTTTYASQDFGP